MSAKRVFSKLIFLLVIFALFAVGCSSDKKVSSMIMNAVSSADEAILPNVDEGHKASAEEIAKLRKTEKLVREVANTYKLVTGQEEAGPFDDMANALDARAQYFETGNKKAYDTFNSLYGKSKEQLLKFADELKGKGL